MGQRSTSLPVDSVFNLRFQSKSLVRMSAVHLKRATDYKVKAKRELEYDRSEHARIHAENYHMEMKASVDSLRMSSRLTAIANRVDQAIQMGEVSVDMSNMVKKLGKCVTSDAIKVCTVMDQFERVFIKMDVVEDVFEKRVFDSVINPTVSDEQTQELVVRLQEETEAEFDMHVLALPTKKKVAEMTETKSDETVTERTIEERYAALST